MLARPARTVQSGPATLISFQAKLTPLRRTGLQPSSGAMNLKPTNLVFEHVRTRANLNVHGWPPSAEGTVIRILWLRFQLFARLYGHRPHAFGFASMG